MVYQPAAFEGVRGCSSSPSAAFRTSRRRTVNSIFNYTPDARSDIQSPRRRMRSYSDRYNSRPPFVLRIYTADARIFLSPLCCPSSFSFVPTLVRVIVENYRSFQSAADADPLDSETSLTTSAVSRFPACLAMSASATMPQQAPLASTTGTRLI